MSVSRETLGGDAVMEAGRELDELVAEKVFRRCRWCWDNREKWLKVPPEEGFEGSSHQVGDKDEIDPLTEERVWYCLKHNELAWTWNIPEYSTEIAAAWEVVEKLTSSGTFQFYIAVNVDRWGCQFLVTGVIEPDGIEAKLAPHAICLAALDALDRIEDQAQNGP